MPLPRRQIAVAGARLAVGLVGAVNVACALAFLFQPERYTAAFEVAGRPGQVMVQALGLAFLMWNATYPPVLWNPERQRALLSVIVAQQALGLAGETWLWWQLPPAHTALAATGLRFILFDGAGLLLLGAARAGLSAWGVKT
ncbi:MAG: hypothetical protein KA764_13440 [Anaerolineales bacterium]|nr:hypothetical protein [Anaerolineales bacterium]